MYFLELQVNVFSGFSYSELKQIKSFLLAAQEMHKTHSSLSPCLTLPPKEALKLFSATKKLFREHKKLRNGAIYTRES